MTKRKNTFIDFTEEPLPPCFICRTTTSQAADTLKATGADTTASAMRLFSSGAYLEWYNTGATTVAVPTIGATGWTYPFASGAIGVEATEGIISTVNKSFTIGTDDAFFVRLKIKPVPRNPPQFSTSQYPGCHFWSAHKDDPCILPLPPRKNCHRFRNQVCSPYSI